ncbi:MAG: DUF21 domain-containing protein [Bacteroidales bacterium]|nr:DUF21 domain-containing protein [Bacteroidales bacterium]
MGNAIKALQLLQVPDRLLATILIGNNLVNVGIVMLSAYITNNLFNFEGSQQLGFIFQVVVVTFFLLLFGEILPKVYASNNVVGFALFMAPALFALERFFGIRSSAVCWSRPPR